LAHAFAPALFTSAESNNLGTLSQKEVASLAASGGLGSTLAHPSTASLAAMTLG